MNNLDNVEQDFEKCKKVIQSCVNKDQLSTANNYYQLWNRKYNYYINLVESPTILYWDGVLTGNMQGKLSEYERINTN